MKMPRLRNDRGGSLAGYVLVVLIFVTALVVVWASVVEHRNLGREREEIVKVMQDAGYEIVLANSNAGSPADKIASVDTVVRAGDMMCPVVFSKRWDSNNFYLSAVGGSDGYDLRNAATSAIANNPSPDQVRTFLANNLTVFRGYCR